MKGRFALPDMAVNSGTSSCLWADQLGVRRVLANAVNAPNQSIPIIEKEIQRRIIRHLI
jgi:hypothetical protein